MTLALLSIVALAATVGTSDSTATLRPVIRAVRVTEPVTIDGVLSEAIWHGDNAVTDFKMRDPDEGSPPSQRSEVRVAYDDDAIYVGARLYDAAPDSIIARLTRRDVSIPADRFSVYLDPYHDRRTGYYFLMNCAGTLFDGTLSNDGWEDASWDGVWNAHARIDSLGWTAEFRIPYSQLRFQKADHQVWGINFRRVIPRHNEEDFVVYQPKKESGFVSRWPDLVGIENIQPGRSIELLPYVTSKAQYLTHSALDPFNDGSKYDPDGGADLRMSVGSKLTLNATINPDFGQVEVDPAVVNLSDVESFFDEKRPFFVEGSSSFQAGQQGANDYWGFNWPGPTFFYPRRIGRAPQVIPDASYADVPLGTRILGAGKLTGKLAPSVSFGTLHAVTRREMGDFQNGSNRWKSEIEPFTYYGVTRALKEFKDRRQGIGLLGTAAVRSFDDRTLRNSLNSSSLLAVSDGWFFLDKKKTWVVSGWSGMSHVRGSKSRITSLQTNSARYFQRPDADHVEVDPNATSLTGFGSRYWLNKQNGSSFMNAAVGFMDPKFDVNDLGFLSRTDVINSHVGGGYKWTNTTKVKKYQDVIGAFFGSWDFQRNFTWGGVWGGGFTEFANNYSFEYKFAYNPETTNPRRTRGGPRTKNKPGFETYLYFDTDGKSKLFYFVDGYQYMQPEAHSWNWNTNPGVEWKPVSNVTLRVGPGYERYRENAQYVATLADPGATATYGSRYVFATLDQTTVSANIRLNWAFSPNLSFQLYAQPLISTGNYTDFKELAAPNSYDFIGPGSGSWTYDPATGLFDADGPGTSSAPVNRDFNIKSLRGNAVLRWEYMPGSTFFLVWTQERFASDRSGDFRFGPSFRELGKADANNIFLAKVTYYLDI